MDMRQILKYLADLSENNNWEWYRAYRMENDRSPLNPSFRAHISSKGKQPVPVGYYLMIKSGGQSFLRGGLSTNMFKDATTMIRDYIAEHGDLAVKKAGFTSRRLYYKAVLHACPVAENRRCFTPLRKTVWRTADNYLQKSYIGFRGVSSTYPKRQY